MNNQLTLASVLTAVYFDCSNLLHQVDPENVLKYLKDVSQALRVKYVKIERDKIFNSPTRGHQCKTVEK